MTFSDDVRREDTKVMLIDALMDGEELYLIAIKRVVVLYAARNGTQRVLLTWRREDGPTIRMGRPLMLQEAMALIDDNWDKRMHMGREGRDLELRGLNIVDATKRPWPER